jgi:hypothetical protein
MKQRKSKAAHFDESLSMDEKLLNAFDPSKQHGSLLDELLELRGATFEADRDLYRSISDKHSGRNGIGIHSRSSSSDSSSSSSSSSDSSSSSSSSDRVSSVTKSEEMLGGRILPVSLAKDIRFVAALGALTGKESSEHF